MVRVMDEIKRKIILAGLLHDTGKLVMRAEPQMRNHSVIGEEYLRQYSPEADEILRAVRYHHARDLKQADLSADDISYIVYEADNIASSTDRRPNESGEAGFNAKAPLESVFNVLFKEDSSADKKAFHLRGLMEDQNKMLYPQPVSSMDATVESYQNLKASLDKSFNSVAPDQMEINELLQVWETIASYVPSSTATNELADISLYDHQKLTAAIAACMYDYFQAHSIHDYKEYCFGSKQDALRNTPAFLMVNADLSGIQKFIYTIPSKGALKSLGGRSFYLELLLEHIADEIFDKMELSRCNLLYSGGGNFHMLLPNTAHTVEILAHIKRSVNSWLMEKFGTKLYLSLAWVECSANDFKLDESNKNTLGEKIRQVRSKIAADKHTRYEQDQLSELFKPQSFVNKTADGTKECSICHSSSVKLYGYMNEADDTLVCAPCRNLRGLGEKLLKHDTMVVTDSIVPGRDTFSMPLPAIVIDTHNTGKAYGDMYLTAIGRDKLEKLTIPIRKIYVKNAIVTSRYMATRLWMGDFSTENAYGTTMELEELAAMAGGDSDGKGIKRLGVMRADVDNLGATFMAGLSPKLATLGRNTALSRQLSLFFKRYINSLCAGEVNGWQEMNQKRFSLFGKEKTGKRKVHIIYSGGDDMFIVGAWDELIELAVDIRHAFQRFTNDKLSFSAGIGFFDSKCPMAEMARASGMLEDAAKSYPDKENPVKNSIALFGVPDAQSHAGYDIAAYSWPEFTDKVCQEKLAFCKECLGYDGNEADTKLPAGKGFLYRMLELLADSQKDGMNIARFAYTIARLEPKKNSPYYNSYQKVRSQLYTWDKNKDDRKQLKTAIELIIYSIRDKA